MLKRIFAIIILILFCLLVVNLTIFHYAVELSSMIYFIIVVFWLLFNLASRRKNRINPEDFLDFEVGYGKEKRNFSIPTKNFIGELTQNVTDNIISEDDLLKNAIENPKKKKKKKN